MFINYKSISNKIKIKTSQAWLFFLDLIFPRQCFGCGSEGSWLCNNCFNQIKIKTSQYCLNCKQENFYGQFCTSCQSQYQLDGVWIAASYEEEIIAKLIKSLKYYFVQDLAQDLAKILILFLENIIKQGRIGQSDVADGLSWQKLAQVQKLPLALLNFKESLVISVPLSARRLRWRGFNQAQVLAQTLASHFGLKLNLGCLLRKKHKKPQAKLSERERQINIKDCFSWRGQNLAGRNIILVDDVVTTGATLNECAKVLKDNGAEEVWGLVAAKG